MQKQDPMKLISVDRVDKGGLGNESEGEKSRRVKEGRWNR